ncbi:hypothetical protein ACJIZ3_013594 [Penstemon smallii]|uniref:Uncharacterized protein n=1 Tax=Penstemon smallii TaxID=265156 RepID=A0ABD3RKN6_9LAMI
MKAFGILFLFLLIGTAVFMYLGCSSKGSTALNPGMVSIHSKNAMKIYFTSRKLKDNMDEEDAGGGGYVKLEDYRPIDPVPNSKASIRHGPIQHGTPLMPYIPKPAPPPTHESKHG